MNPIPKYFIARHDLHSFLAWPRVVWRTGEAEFPRGLKKMKVGDYWIAFAYINDEVRREKTQQVVGFYRCAGIPERRSAIPSPARKLVGNSKYAWVLKGKSVGKPLSFPVTVPSVTEMLGKETFKQQTLTPITKEQFEKIQGIVMRRKMDAGKIPLLRRDPRNEQEVVAILVTAHKSLGIEQIERLRCGFPDMLVKLKGRRQPIHLEVETYSKSFLLHKHQLQMRGGRLITKVDAERLPVAVACWYHDAKNGCLSKHVRKVFEIRELLQKKQPMQWRE